MTFKCPVYVQIYQHCVHFSPGTFCSHVPPEALVSYGNTLHISFSSNDKVVDTGFTASWKAVDPTEGKVGGKWGKKNLREKPSLTIRLFLSLPCGTRTHAHTSAPCGGSFSSSQGEVRSPNWPRDYQAQSVCTWRIEIPSAKSIHVAFTHFELQAANQFENCMDYVEVFNGKTMSSLGW